MQRRQNTIANGWKNTNGGLTSNGYTYNEAGKPDTHCRRKGVLPDKEKG